MIAFIIFSVCFIAGAIIMFKYYEANNFFNKIGCIEPSKETKDFIEHTNNIKTAIADELKIPSSIIESMKQQEENEIRKYKHLVNKEKHFKKANSSRSESIPSINTKPKTKKKYKRNKQNFKITNDTIYGDDLISDMSDMVIADVIYNEIYNDNNNIDNSNYTEIETPSAVYNHYEEARTRQAERAAAVEDAYNHEGFGSGGGGGSTGGWSDSGSSSSYDSGSSDSGSSYDSGGSDY